jgi:uncharacterized membrane protein YedE/YeeE
MNKQNIVVLIGGILFGFGLAYSGMAKQEIVLSFLQLKDLGLIFVMGGAAFVTFFAINVVPRFLKAPFLGGKFKPRKAVMSKNVIIGAVIFGVGWGLSGQCPGSALASLGMGNLPILVGLAAIFIGAYLRELLDKK